MLLIATAVFLYYTAWTLLMVNELFLGAKFLNTDLLWIAIRR